MAAEVFVETGLARRLKAGARRRMSAKRAGGGSDVAAIARVKDGRKEFDRRASNEEMRGETPALENYAVVVHVSEAKCYVGRQGLGLGELEASRKRDSDTPGGAATRVGIIAGEGIEDHVVIAVAEKHPVNKRALA